MLDESAGHSLSFQKIKDRVARIPDFFKATSRSSFVIVKSSFVHTQGLFVDALATVLTEELEIQ